MIDLNRTIGLVRSLAIYGAIPLRARRLRRLYSQFVEPNDLVFDIGGHIGSRTAAFEALGCRVVVLEPLPAFARFLSRRFAHRRNVTIVAAAASHTVGHAELAISDRTPTVSTLVNEWREARGKEAGFVGVRWNRTIRVETTTLDALIAQYGVPAFTKIDVEGAEPDVLAGLSQPIPALSFEYLLDDLERTARCLDRLQALGDYRFNWSVAEENRLRSPAWISADRLLAELHKTASRRRSGDVYARHNST